MLNIYLSPVLPVISSKLSAFLGISPQSFNELLMDWLINVDIQPAQACFAAIKSEDVSSIDCIPDNLLTLIFFDVLIHFK